MRSPLRIIIAEDEALTALALQMELEREGHQVVGNFSTGEQVLAFFEKNQADLILMDLSLAGSMTGFDAAKKIVEKHTVSIIILSGYPDKLIKDALQDLPGAHYLPKPVESERLMRLIQSLPHPN